MALELDHIKLQTTWNDAAGSINNNFAKLKLAIAEGVSNGLTLEEIADYLDENGYINEITEEMLSEVLGSEGNEGKYLVATEEGLGWKEAETPDWNAQAGEDGFIKNKTHGFESQCGKLTNNGDSCIWHSHYGNDLYIAIDGNSNYIKIIKNAQVGNTYRVNNGPPTDIEITTDDTGNRIITLVDNYEYHKVYPVRIFGSVDTLDDIFIPSTIARVTDIPTQVSSDWDAAAGETGYVKNRPFYTTWSYKANYISVSSSSPITLSGAVQIGNSDFLSATVSHQGKKYVCQGIFEATEGTLTFNIGGGKKISFQKSYKSLTISTTDTSYVTIELIKVADTFNIVKIDDIYIPSTIARKTDINGCAKLDDGYVIAKGIVNQDDVYYHLPNNAPENDADHTLATEGYADLHPRYVEVENTEDIVFPEVEGTPKKMRLRFREGEIFVDSYEAISGSVKIARLGRHSSLHTTPDVEEGVRVKKNGWRIYDHRTRNQGSSSYVLESIYLVLHAERNGYKRYKVMFINKNNGQGMVGTPMNLMGCFGIVGDNYADVRKGHTRETFDQVKCFASQIYALVIDGVYLPFRLTAIREANGMRYGGTPLNI